MNMSSDGMSTMSLSVAADLFLYAAPPNYFLKKFLHLKTRCLQGMHLVRAIALDSNPPLNVWSVFTYWYCKSSYQYCLTKNKSSLYFTKQLEEDGRQRGEKPKGPRNMSYGVSFLLWVTHSYGVSFELCGTAKSSSQLWCFLTFELVSDKKSCDITEIEDAQNRIFCYNNTFSLREEWGEVMTKKKKQTNQLDINLWGNERYGDCSTVVTWVAISESANVSFSEQPQLLLLFQSKHFADVKALCCG
jgi:hypothetical protein